MSLIGRFMGAQSGGTKAPRFDMGTDCGLQYADIMVVQLPGSRAAYEDDFNAVRAEVRSRLGSPGPRNIVVLADTLSSQPPGWWYGLGSPSPTSAPARSTQQRRRLLRDAVRARRRAGPRRGPDGWWPEGMLHE